MHPILGALLLLLLVKARGMQEVYCQGNVGLTSFNATGAVTVTTAPDLNTALVVATDTSQPCTSVITIGASGTFFLSQSYSIPNGASLTLQAGPGLGPNDIILMAATSTMHFYVSFVGVLVATGIQFTGGKSSSVKAQGKLTIFDSIFSSNSSPDFGGAIHVGNGGEMTASNCTFSSNQADSGGAISNTLGNNVELVDCTFTNNEATHRDGSAADYGGGAIYNKQNMICTGCTFTNNLARNNGGAVLNYNFNAPISGFFTCYGCIFQNNNAGQGGAIWSRKGDNNCNANDPSNLPCQNNGLTLMYCTWSGNTVTSGSSETRGSNIFVYATNGCWCTYLTGTSDPAGGINRDGRCQCNPEGAPTASPTPAPTGPTPVPTPVRESGVNQTNRMRVPSPESSRTIVMSSPLFAYLHPRRLAPLP
jgi:hypothetical protein